MIDNNHYKGYHPSEPGLQIDRISSRIDAGVFFKDYVLARRPCIITEFTDEFSELTVENLENNAAFMEQIVKVEKKSKVTGTFGVDDEKRIIMTVRDLLKQLKTDDGLYLSTQYEDVVEDCDENDDVPSRKKQKLSPEDIDAKIEANSLLPGPIPALLGQLPLRPTLLAQLVPQQINMWLGSSKEGSSSGLHHDFQDNLYLLLKGQKRFVIVSPKDAALMKTYGEILNVHSNGLISYVDGIRSDGLELSLSESDAEEFGDEDSEEFDWDAKDDFQDEGLDIGEMDHVNPPSFSKISVSEVHKMVEGKESTELRGTHPLCFTLKHGEMLYLPASWFHEVTSFSNTSVADGCGAFKNTHVALNYWFHPPSLENPPYEDNAWLDKFKLAKKYINQHLR